jgi:hypothetical protein
MAVGFLESLAGLICKSASTQSPSTIFSVVALFFKYSEHLLYEGTLVFKYCLFFGRRLS